jgi:hypothetical protein
MHNLGNPPENRRVFLYGVKENLGNGNENGVSLYHSPLVTGDW